MKVSDNMIEKRTTRGRVSRWLCGAAVVALTASASSPSYALVFDWTLGVGSSPSNGVIPVPRLGNDTDLAALDAFLSGQAVKAVKVIEPLTVPGSFFNAAGIDYVFADFEGGRDVRNTQDLVALAGGPNRFIGNFGGDPFHPDSTNPNPSSGQTAAGYFFSQANMSNANLYPGSPSFRSLALGNDPNTGGSTAPNVLSSLFTLPLIRQSGVEALHGTAIFPDAHENNPFVARFNVTGSPLVNSQYNTPHGPIAAWETTDQLLSRGDFSALVAHLRLRGADNIQLLDPGVVGYSRDEMHEDAVAGWEIFDGDFGSNSVLATLGTDIELAGSGQQSIEEAGIVWSGVINPDEDTLVVLLSNLSDSDEDIILPEEIFGEDVVDREFAVAAGTHLLLDFGLVTGLGPFVEDGWNILNNPNEVFAGGNDPGGRGGIGIPEPASLVMLAIGGLLIGLPRSARRGKASV